jgi:hypothetical protein
MSAASDFVANLGAEVAGTFGADVEYFRAPRLLVWHTSFGGSFVSLDGSNKWSPYITVSFYFGNRYEDATKIERAIGTIKRQQRPGHILQYSVNAHLMKGLAFSSDFTWRINIHKPPTNLASSIADAIRQIAFPFWNRYPTVRSARDALVSEDTWCFHAGGSLWHDLLYLDAALDELEHYHSWLAQLDPFYVPYASAELLKVQRAATMQSNNSLDRTRER